MGTHVWRVVSKPDDIYGVLDPCKLKWESTMPVHRLKEEVHFTRHVALLANVQEPWANGCVFARVGAPTVARRTCAITACV